MDFNRDFNGGRASDRRLLPDFSSDGFLQSLDTNPFLEKTNNGLDLCKELSKMGISCDMSIWTKPQPFRVDPVDFGSTRTTFHGVSGFDPNLSFDARQGFLQSSSHGVSQPDHRLLAFQDSLDPNRFTEMMMMIPNNNRDFLFDHLNGPRESNSSPYLRNASFVNDPYKTSLMFECNRVSRALTPMEGSGASYPEDSLRGVSLENNAFNRSLMFEGKRVSPALPVMEASGSSYPKSRSGLPLNIASMVNVYGSVCLMAKDQIGCRVLQKLVDEGTLLDAFEVIFLEIIANVFELSTDPFGNYLIQKLLDVCDDEQRTLIVSVLTSRPMVLVKISLNTYGTRVVQKMIETVKTKQQIAMVKSSLKPGFLTLVKDLNGNHVIQTCLHSLTPNDNKFLLDAATKYSAEIATHRHGCCVLQCCILNSAGEQRERLISEISRNSLHLSQDPFGNYVVQYLIEQKVSSGKLLIQFRMHYAELATQKFSSHVIEKCLRVYPESRTEIVRELLSVPNFEQLLQDPFANYVIQTALSVSKGPVHARLVEKVYRYGKLKSSPYCKKIFSKIILKK